MVPQFNTSYLASTYRDGWNIVSMMRKFKDLKDPVCATEAWAANPRPRMIFRTGPGNKARARLLTANPFLTYRSMWYIKIILWLQVASLTQN